MSVLISSRPRAQSDDVVDLLMECHGRIRSFCALAARLASTRDASDDTIRDAARRVRTYFVEALPLHVADEEESILPRLRGRSPDLDAALARMRAEHDEHETTLRALVELMVVIEASPASLESLRAPLGDVAAKLATELERHLLEEESTILPALRATVSAEEQAAIRRELRARRA